MQSKNHYITWPHLIIAFILVFALPFLVDRDGKGSAPVKRSDSFWRATALVRSSDRCDFDDSHLKQLNKKKPEYVFVGNSELEATIDVDYFDQEMAPKKCVSLFNRRGLSAIWYLVIQHHLVPSGVKPEWVFIFFRSTSLTEPGRGSEEMWKFAPTLIAGEDRVFDDILDGVPVYWKDRIHDVYPRLYPVVDRRKGIEIRLREMSTVGWMIDIEGDLLSREDVENFKSYEKSWSRNQINALFDLSNVRTESQRSSFLQHDFRNFRNAGIYMVTDFEYWAPRSFLPQYIKIAKEQGFKLCFVHLKDRPDAPISLKYGDKYFDDLESYIAENGCYYIDFSDDPDIDLSWYGIDSHINEEHKIPFTKKFLAEFRRLSNDIS